VTHHFFEKDPNNKAIYHPTVSARGPWDPNSLHGRVISGLIAYEVETNYCDASELEKFQVARITVDLFRPPPMSPLFTGGDVIRSGRRIKVVDVHISADFPDRGITEIARGRVVMLRKSENPPGSIWSPPLWDLKPPSEDHPPHRDPSSVSKINPPMWQTIESGQNMEGEYPSSVDSLELPIRKLAWVRETHNFISGEQASPLVCVAQVADVANPFANSGTNGLNYINADISLYLQRNPVGCWIGTEAFYHDAYDGVSVGTIALYDKLGRIGTSTVCGLGQVRS
jgi:hypothetical protein